MKEEGLSLKRDWGIFITIIISPIVLITFAFTILGIFFSSQFTSNTTLTIILSALASLSAGILGGIVWDRYKEITGNSAFLKKGKSAVRNLSLISDQLNRLRIRIFEINKSKNELSIDELDHHLLTTDKNVTSAIEDWVDMVPDLNTLARIAQSVAEKGNKIKKLLNDKAELEKKLAKQDQTQKSMISNLTKKIEQKDLELEKTYSEISKLKGQQIYISGPTISSGINARIVGSARELNNIGEPLAVDLPETLKDFELKVEGENLKIGGLDESKVEEEPKK
jgi:hypothetical protein